MDRVKEIAARVGVEISGNIGADAWDLIINYKDSRRKFYCSKSKNLPEFSNDDAEALILESIEEEAARFKSAIDSSGA